MSENNNKLLLLYIAHFYKGKEENCYILLSFKEIHKILSIDNRKTSALKTRMSKKCGTSADADIRPIPN